MFFSGIGKKSVYNTKCAMTGFVHAMEYIELPIVEAYGMLFISSISFSIEWLCCEFNLKWLARGVENDLKFFMLNFSRTRSM